MLPTTLTPDHRHVVARVPHFSFISAFVVKVKELATTLKETILDGLTSNFNAQATPPLCQDESGAREDGYAIASDSKNTIYWCFGVEDGKRVLRVVNNRRYPLAVSHPGMSVIDTGSTRLDFSRLSRLLSGGQTIISPRDEVVFGVDLEPGTQAWLKTELDGLGQSLYQLEVGVSAAVEKAL